MRMLQSILLATDFRPAAEAAADTAARLATAFGSRVIPLYAVEPMPTLPITVDEHRAQAHRMLAELIGRLSARDVAVGEPLTPVGPTALTVIQTAQELDVDLIVLGTGNAGWSERAAVGPTTEAILAQAPQPVLAVRAGGRPVTFRKVLCPVDHSTVARRGLLNAARLARAFGGELVVLSVVPAVSWLHAAAETGRLTRAQQEHAARWREEFASFLENVSLADVHWTPEVREGAADEQIAEAARAHGADVIVMGATGRTGLARALLGGTTRRLLRRLSCSLLTVKQEDLTEELFQGDLAVISELMAEGRELMRPGCHLTAAAKFRQVLGLDPFHPGALEGAAAACEQASLADDARRYRDRLGRLRPPAAPA